MASAFPTESGAAGEIIPFNAIKIILTSITWSHGQRIPHRLRCGCRHVLQHKRCGYAVDGRGGNAKDAQEGGEGLLQDFGGGRRDGTTPQASCQGGDPVPLLHGVLIGDKVQESNLWCVLYLCLQEKHLSSEMQKKEGAQFTFGSFPMSSVTFPTTFTFAMIIFMSEDGKRSVAGLLSAEREHCY